MKARKKKRNQKKRKKKKRKKKKIKKEKKKKSKKERKEKTATKQLGLWERRIENGVLYCVIALYNEGGRKDIYL